MIDRHLQHSVRPSNYKILIIMLLSLAGFACGSSTLSPLPQDAVIVAFGDSLTRGKGVTEAASYPTVLADLTGLTVLNHGISGETTAEGLQRLPAVLDASTPDLLLLMHGGNDILRNLSPVSAKANLQAMIDAADSRSIPVVLIGIPEKKLFSSVAPAYRELAQENNLLLEDEIIKSLLLQPKMKSDSVHFNQKGYAAIAESIWELLQTHGAL